MHLLCTLSALRRLATQHSQMVFMIFVILTLQVGKLTDTFSLAASPGRPLQTDSVNDSGNTMSWGDMALPLARWRHTLHLMTSSSWVKIVDLRNKAHQDKTEIQVFWSTQEQRDYLGDWGWWGRVLLPGDPLRGHVWVMLGPPMQSSNLLHPSCNLTQPMRDKPNRAGCHRSNLGAPQSPMNHCVNLPFPLGSSWVINVVLYF